MPDDPIKLAADALIGLDPAERERALQRLKLLVAAAVPGDQLSPIPVRTLADYLVAELPIPPKIIEPALVVRGEITATIGKSGKGKTTMNLHRMMRWAGGLPMFDALPHLLVPADGPVKVLVIENEGSAGMFQEKMQTMINAEGYLPDDGTRYVVGQNFLVWGEGGYSGLKIDSDKDYSLLRRATEQWRPDILYVEPLRGLYRGDENSNTEVAEVLDRFQALATDYSMAVVLAHHEKKNRDVADMMDIARGASALDGVVATMENFQTAKNGDYRELSWSKIRYVGPEGYPAPVRMEYDPLTRWYRYVPEDMLERSVIEFMQKAEGQPVTYQDVADGIGEDYKKVQRTMNKMEDAKKLRRGNRVGTQIGWLLNREDSNDGLEF